MHNANQWMSERLSEWVCLCFCRGVQNRTSIDFVWVAYGKKELHFCIEFGLFVFVCSFRKNPQSHIVRNAYVYFAPKIRLLIMRSETGFGQWLCGYRINSIVASEWWNGKERRVDVDSCAILLTLLSVPLRDAITQNAIKSADKKLALLKKLFYPAEVRNELAHNHEQN